MSEDCVAIGVFLFIVLVVTGIFVLLTAGAIWFLE